MAIPSGTPKYMLRYPTKYPLNIQSNILEVPKIGVPPNHHPFIVGIFPELNQPAIGVPPNPGNPHLSIHIPSIIQSLQPWPLTLGLLRRGTRATTVLHSTKSIVP